MADEVRREWFDKDYYAGGNSRFSAQPSTPRTISLSSKFSF